MSQQATILRFKGCTVADDYIDRVLLNTNYVGVAVHQLAAGKQPSVAVIHKKLSDMSNQKDQVTKMLKLFPDRDLLVHFGTLNEGEKDSLMQPFPVLFNSENKAVMVAFMDGIPSAQEELEKWLIPHCQDAFEYTQFNIALTMKRLQDKARDFAVICGEPTSQVNLLDCLGNHATFAPKGGQAGQDYEWGWATSSFEEGTVTEEAKPPVETPVVEVPLTEEEELQRALNGDGEAPGPITAPPAGAPASQVHKTETKPTALNAPAVHPAVLRKQAAAAAAAGKTVPAISVPKNDPAVMETVIPKPGMRKDDLVRFIVQKCKYEKPPANYWEDYQKGTLKLLVPKTAMAAALVKAETAIPKEVKADVKQNVTKGADKNAPKVEVPKADPTASIPVLTATAREAAMKVIATLDKAGEDIIPPNHMKTYEEKLPHISKQLALTDFREALSWGVEGYTKIQASSPEALPKLTAWFAIELWKRMKDEKPAATAVHPAVARRQAAAGR